MPEEFDLRRSKEVVGYLYPVLLDAHGNIIDGFHRLEADPDWPTHKLDWVKDEKTRELVRAHANLVRRHISLAERKRQFEELAKLMEKAGVEKPRVASEMAKVVPFSDRYVQMLLPDEYKQMEHAPEPEIFRVEPVYTGEDWECPVCGAVYRLFHTSNIEHKFDLAKEGKIADN